MNSKSLSRENLLLSLFCLLCIFRFSYLGFSYTPYLDDYIQYSFYPSFENPWKTILAGGVGTLFTRPLAGLFDFFVWSRFWDRLGIAVLILSLIYGLSGVLFYKAFSSVGLSVSPVFLVVYAFLPLNTEGTYWLSASSRIVVSLFLTALSCFFIVRNKVLLFFLFNLASMWFYEQTALLSFSAAVIFILLAKKNFKRIFLPFLSIALLTAFYLCFGRFSDNTDRLAPIGAQTVFSNAAIRLSDFKELFFTVHGRLIKNGFLRGFERILGDSAYLWLAVLVVLTALVFEFSKDIPLNAPSVRRKLIIGIILTLAPLLPFFVTVGNTPNFRNTVISLVGIALILDAVVPQLFKAFTPAVLSLCMFCFIIVTVSEVCDYEYTAAADLKLARTIAQSLPDTAVSTAEEFEYTITTPKYYPQNAPFHDHIISMSGSDWGVTGIVRTVSKRKNIKIIVK